MFLDKKEHFSEINNQNWLYTFIVHYDITCYVYIKLLEQSLQIKG